MNEWRNSLESFLDRAWTEIGDMKTPRSGTPGLITLANIGDAAYPEIRTVVLQRVNRDAGTVETFTDSKTPKITDFIANSKASVLIWQPLTGLQIRLVGSCRVVQGENALSEWENIPEVARKNYGVTPVPGTVIPEPGQYERIPHPDRLANLEITISQMDVVHLAKPYDIRARYCRREGWIGEWLSP